MALFRPMQKRDLVGYVNPLLCLLIFFLFFTGVRSYRKTFKDAWVTDEGMELVKLMIIHRHGDRTPVTQIDLPFDKGTPPNFPCTHQVHQTGYTQENTNNANEEVANHRKIKDSKSVSQTLYRKIYEKGCPMGELTALGCQQLGNLGGILNKEYSPLFPVSLSANQVYLRSTDYPRTQRSLECLMNAWGLLASPEIATDQPHLVYDVHVQVKERDTMFPKMCPGFLRAMGEAQKGAEWANRRKDFTDQLDTDLQKALQLDEDTYRGNLKGGFAEGYEHYFDLLHTRLSHNLSFPPTVSMDLYKRVRDEASTQLYMLFKNEKVAQLGIGRFIGELIAAMQSTTGPRIQIYSGHDSTLFPLLTTLNMWDHDWPGYSSHIEILLLRVPHNSQIYVKFIYRNSGVTGWGEERKVIEPDWCKVDDLLGLCPLEMVVAHWIEFVPKDYDAECK